MSENLEYPIHKYFKATFMQQLKFLKLHYPNFGNEPAGHERFDFISASRDLSGSFAGYYHDINKGSQSFGPSMYMERQLKYSVVVQRDHADEMFNLLYMYENQFGAVSLELIPDYENGPFIG